MSSVNKVILVGRLGRNPEVRYTSGGEAVANLSVATEEHWTDKGGRKQKRTEWHHVTVWGKPAETCGEFLFKGREVAIVGKIQTEEWTDKDGGKRKAMKIVASEVAFLGDRGSGAPAGGEQPPRDDEAAGF